jgi:hypothetical protein
MVKHSDFLNPGSRGWAERIAQKTMFSNKKNRNIFFINDLKSKIDSFPN